MKKTIIITFLLTICLAISGQPAKNVLDKVSSTLSNKEGFKANFILTNDDFGTSKGNICVKGKMFKATTETVDIWYDGKTQWTYLKHSDEVNITTPTEHEQHAINPYSFINIYRDGYKYSMKTNGSKYEIHLIAQKQKSIQEMFITVDKKNYVPTKIRMRQGSKWNTITISEINTGKLSDNIFKFNKKDYPTAEIIDLR